MGSWFLFFSFFLTLASHAAEPAAVMEASCESALNPTFLFHSSADTEDRYDSGRAGSTPFYGFAPDTDKKAQVEFGHFNDVVSFAPVSNQHIWVGTSTGMLRRYEATRGIESALALKGQAGEIRDVLVIRKESLIVSVSSDGTAWVRDPAKEGKLLTRLEEIYGKVSRVALSPDERKLAVIGEKCSGVFDLDTLKPVVFFKITNFRRFFRWIVKPPGIAAHLASVTQLEWTPDGTKVLSVSTDGAPTKNQWVWDVATGKLERRLPPPAEQQPPAERNVEFAARSDVISVSMQASGRVALTAYADGIVVIWERETGKVLHGFVIPKDLRMPGNKVYFYKRWIILRTPNNQMRIWAFGVLLS